MTYEQRQEKIRHIISMLDRLGLVAKEGTPHTVQEDRDCHQTSDSEEQSIEQP